MTDAADDIIDLYRRHARTWAASRGKSLFEKLWLDRFLARVPLTMPEGGTVLDLGGGAGDPVARYIAAQGRAVTGVDSSPEMIAMFRDTLPDAEAICADMRALALGRTFGGVLAWNSFFHLDYDAQRAMFPVFAAHAAPGAPLMFTSGPDFGVAMGTLEGDPLFHASLSHGEYESLLDAHGFDLVLQVDEDPDCNGHTVWLARRRKAR